MELQIGDLRLSFAEAEEILRAIRAGEVDAVVVKGENGHQIFTFRDPSHPYRLLVEAMSEGAALLTFDGLISYHNPQFGKLAVAEEGDVSGRSLRELVVPDDVPALEALFDRASAGAARAEVRFARDASQPVAVQLSVSPGSLAGVRVFCVVASDLADHRQQEELYRRARVEIEARDRLFSVAAHELRGPLGTLNLQAQFLIMRLKDADKPDGGAAMERCTAIADALYRQTGQMAELVGKLLDFGIIGAGRLQLAPENVDLAEVVRTATERSAELLGRSVSEVKLELEPVAGRWDRVRLGQVVTNLLSNAAKYGRGRPVRVAVQPDAERARLVVEDNGDGIPPDERERIFRPFERMAVASKSAPGLGLGLYIAAEIVRAHGGSIRAEESAGGGARFVVELPTQGPA